MEKFKVECIHTCRNNCMMLNQLLVKETELLNFYEGIYAECNYPDIQNFIIDRIKEKRELVDQIKLKIVDIKELSKIMDGLIKSFEE